jgi:glycosyltransferase involved in cell wall biosynthesis
MAFIRLVLVPSRDSVSPPPRVAAFIGARVFIGNDGQYSTDSSLVYELVELARQFDVFFLHCFVIEGESARDALRPPPSLQLVDLGKVSCGRDLYGHPLRLWRRVRDCVRAGDWSHAVIAEPQLTSLFAMAACRRKRRAAILLIRGDPSAGPMAQRHRHGLQAVIGTILRRFSSLTAAVLASAVCVVTDSDTLRARLVKRGGAARYLVAASIAKADVLPPGQAWPGAGNGPMHLLFVGRLERVKDIETLLEALGEASRTGRSYVLRIVGAGDPDYTRLLHRRVRQLHLDGAVRFLGPVPHGRQLYEFYRQAHALVLSSLSEGTPKVVVEAMAHGLPVVATSVGGLPRVVTRRSGILVPAAEPAELSKALMTVYDSPVLARSMAIAARQAAAGLLAEPVSRELASLVLTEAQVPRLRLAVLSGKGA